jgi:hypothetical protein
MAALLLLPSGRDYPPRLSELGGTGHVVIVAADVQDVAERAGVDPTEIAALLIGENRNLDPEAVSKRGLSAGPMQLRVGGPHHEAWMNACRAVPSQCARSALLVGARVLREGLDACGGDFLCAVLRYRHGPAGARRAHPRERDFAVVELAVRIRALMGGDA